MKLVVIGNGMVGHKLRKELMAARHADLEITVLCRERLPVHGRVHLSGFFAGKNADDLLLVTPGFGECDLHVIANFDPEANAAVFSRGFVGSPGECAVVASPIPRQHFGPRTGECLKVLEHSVQRGDDAHVLVR